MNLPSPETRNSMSLEVHEHWWVSGPNAHKAGMPHLKHSHPGGGVPHQHPHTGPASYTIDKDKWFKETGLRGGGRKKFTTRATGVQLPWVPLEDWQTSFKVIIGTPTPELGEGPGIALPMRLILGCKMNAEVIS